MSPRLRTIGLLTAVAVAAGLAGCGKVSTLDRPRPLFGTPNDNAPETDARHAAAVRARADNKRLTTGYDGPQSVEELRGSTAPGHHRREEPIQAAPGDPDASQPQDPPAPPVPATDTPQTPR